jgi:hypothetical protein
MRRLATIAIALVLLGGVAGCGGSVGNPCDHPNSVACEEHKRGEEDKEVHNYVEELKHRGQEEHHE